MTRSALTFSLVGSVLVLSTACAKKPAPESAPQPVASATEDRDAAERARRDSIERENARRRAEREAREAEERRRAEMQAALTGAIYFEFDQSALSEDAQSMLDAKIPALTSDQNLRVRIVGHTDERGSDEYNMALGQRRAVVAKRYLTQRGIDASRIEVMSLGEERPAAQGGDERAYAQNRRDEFQVLGVSSASR
jgi:peptidoglycan-associated lipoprotein